jgi:hypothetical protein
MNDRVGLIILAAAIVFAAIIISVAFRYGPAPAPGLVLDHWTGKYAQ